MWQVELDPYCRRVLEKHFPRAERFEDVRTVGKRNLPWVDIISGGFPCQDISNAGKRAGIDGERSGLWSEYARIVRELRPRYVVVENVAALLGRGMERVLGDLAACGYDAEWQSIRASDVGAPHRRERIWIVAYSNGSGPSSEWNRIFAWQDNAVSASSGALANPEEFSGELRPAEGKRSRGFAGSGTDVADATSTRCDGRTRQEQSVRGRSLLSSRFSGCGTDVADTDGERLPQRFRAAVGTPSGNTEPERLHSIGKEWWAVEPDVGRVAHGIPARVDRLRGLGNGIVPQIAEWIGRRILAHGSH